MAIHVTVTPGQRERALKALLLHPLLQLQLWTEKHPLSRQDMAENFMVGWLPCHAGYPERERAANLVAKEAALEEIRQAARFGRQGFGDYIPDVQMLYEWVDSKDQIVYVGITKDLRERRIGHERFRIKPGMKMRMVGFGTVDDETALIHSRLLAGAPLLNTKMTPLRGLDVFGDCSARHLAELMVVGIQTGIPIPRKLPWGDIGTKKSNSDLLAMRWNARITISESQSPKVQSMINGRHRLRKSTRACMAPIQDLNMPAWNLFAPPAETVCMACGSLGMCPIQANQENQVHADPACCGKIDDSEHHIHYSNAAFLWK